jgi:hypothetical protein
MRCSSERTFIEVQQCVCSPTIRPLYSLGVNQYSFRSPSEDLKECHK